MTMNKAWHRAHPMPARATRAQRLAWHEAHAKACGCRPIPAGLQRQLGSRRAGPTAPALRRRHQPRRLHRRNEGGVRLDRHGPGHRLRGHVPGVRYGGDGPQDARGDEGDGRRPRRAAGHRRHRRVLAHAEAGHLPARADHARGPAPCGPGTEGQAGQGHLVVRRRQAVSLPSRRGPGGYRGGGRHPGDSRRRDSAAPTRRQDEAGARRFQAAAEDRHRVLVGTPFPAASGPRRASGSSARAPARRRRPQRSAECSRSRRSSPGGGRSTNTGGCSR